MTEASARPRAHIVGADAEQSQPDWFKTAVFYEVLVRSFRDSNGDGTGDFRGLIEKLDYLAVAGRRLPLGAAVLHLAAARRRLRRRRLHLDPPRVRHGRRLPRRSLDAAHERGMRVIIDFVMNHTSRRAPVVPGQPRSDPDGPYGDFYVWSDTDELYEDARIIFVDTEPSNWTWDPVRQQYFWHRFFSHQPDLNFDNPKVHEAMLEAMSFWLDMGLDGFRLDAVPYLYEREGTNGENLPETHEFLQAGARASSTTNYPGRVLLAEANQWPERRRRLLRRLRGRRRRVPHVLPLPGDAAHLHGRPPRVALPDLGDPRADPGDPRRAASGASSCATTTSSPSRWSPTRTATTCGASTPRTRG